MKKYLLLAALLLLLPLAAYSWIGPIFLSGMAASSGVADPTDQFTANPVFSVGVTATELDNEGTIMVASNIATFSIAFPTNVGAGDVVQYDVDNGGDIGNDEYGIIHGISTDRLKAYLLKTNGGSVTNTTASTSVYDIFRAYTSLTNCENSVENTNIDVDCRDDYDLTDGNLTDADDEDGPLYVLCYADGNDTTIVNIDTTYWSTDVDDYIKVYTPIATSEVGTSQRHNGTRSATGYKLVVNSSNPTILIGISHVQIEGLQISNTFNGGCGIRVNNTPDKPGEIYVSENIIIGSGASSSEAGFTEIAVAASDKYYFKNNIIYDWSKGIEIIKSDPAVAWEAYIYNNTLCDNVNYGIYTYRCDGTFRLKNNLVQNSGTDYLMASFGGSVTTEYIDNLSEDSTSPNNEHDSKTVVFENESENDFHLGATDANATDQGTSLASDGDLPFTKDIDEDVRGVTWSIGADD